MHTGMHVHTHPPSPAVQMTPEGWLDSVDFLVRRSQRASAANLRRRAREATAAEVAAPPAPAPALPTDPAEARLEVGI